MTSFEGTAGSRYDVIGPIGRGGMADVNLALMAIGGGARRLAVLKRIWPDMAADPDFMAMFLDEARLSLCLNHPNIVQTYELLADGNEIAIAMEYLDGQPLTRVLTRLNGPEELSLPLKLRVLTRVLGGLAYAHTLTDFAGDPLGVVHRDVSPQNVFVGYDGQVKLVDFGVAKSMAASHQTRPGAIKGKLAYMAPEQVRGGTTDRRADLFSVGVMLWEILAGRRLWQRMSEADILAHLVSGRPLPPLPVDAAVQPSLAAICAHALALDVEKRYQAAADFEADLEGALAGSADSHARSLGRLVSRAFAAERAERRAMIERHLGGGAPVPPAPAAPASRPGRPTPSQMDRIEAGLTRVIEEQEARLSRIIEQKAVAPPPPTRSRVRWFRRGVAIAALAAAAVVTVRNGSPRDTRQAAAEGDRAHPAPAPTVVTVAARSALAPVVQPIAGEPAPPPDRVTALRAKRHRRPPLLRASDAPEASSPGASEPEPADVSEGGDRSRPTWPGLPPIRSIIVEDPFTR